MLLGHVVQKRHFRLLGTNGFHVKAKINDDLTRLDFTWPDDDQQFAVETLSASSDDIVRQTIIL